ncbi:MAG: serine/threonine-protein kinase, partial [Gemmatimonadales bacterium]
MPPELDRQKAALADRYAVEREIGAGGMATVYLARDLKHDRQVAVKVLRPDLAVALGPDRFLQEIEIAAQLHHPHIMPLYDSGRAGGQADLGDEFLFYVMPYEEGQSLRERLAKQGELPIPEVVRLLEQVVDALAHAHERGVVHRDIKPENIMLSRQHAIVTDFGVAKAVSEATGRQHLTTAGVALGTPSYMAPEQASADPNIDQRADIYAVGIVAYELLTGQPPFTANTPQGVLAAHLTQKPEPVSTHRETVPPALEALVMRCLEKKAADRWQSADELAAQLRAMGATPTAGITPTAGVAPVKRWTPFAKVGIAAAALVVLAGAYGVMQFGKVGRAGTLIGQELLAEHDLILVAEFGDRTDDATLGQTVTDAVRVELQQSPVVEVLSQAGMWAGMQRMGLATGTALPDSQVRELAERENAKAYVAGEVSSLGAGYQITARVIATADGTEALTVRVTAANDDELIGALEELGLQLRSEIGESLRSVRSAPPLGQLTTSSLPALRALMAGSRAERGGNRARAITLIEEALRLDSTFATAWRSLAVMHANSNRYKEAKDAIARAYVYRDRLPERERLGVTSMYHSLRSEYDLAEAAERQIIDLDPDAAFGYVGLSDVLLNVHRWPEAEAAALEGVEKEPDRPIGYWNAVEAQI